MVVPGGDRAAGRGGDADPKRKRAFRAGCHHRVGLVCYRRVTVKLPVAAAGHDGVTAKTE